MHKCPFLLIRNNGGDWCSKADCPSEAGKTDWGGLPLLASRSLVDPSGKVPQGFAAVAPARAPERYKFTVLKIGLTGALRGCLTARVLLPKVSAATAFAMQKQSHRLTRTRAGLIVVDIQERLLPAIFEKERVVLNAVRLIRGAAILRMPVFATEQYRKGLGPTVPEVAAAIPAFTPMEKLAFSACGAAGFIAALKRKKVSDVLLCGIEAHVCVSQTCLDLVDQGFRVFVAADATSSRTPESYRFGLDRMRAAGAVIVSTEMALFELLEQAGTAEFKQILALVK